MGGCEILSGTRDTLNTNSTNSVCVHVQCTSKAAHEFDNIHVIFANVAREWEKEFHTYRTDFISEYDLKP